MDAAWFIRSRQMATDFRFWLAITGYNPRDRSLSQRIYLVYAAIFFSIWGFAVLSYLASTAAGLLTTMDPSAPASAAAGLMALALIVWGIYRLFRATRRSPIVFSEDDRYLICQTPADRRAVALAWFPSGWISSALPFWAIAVTFGFAQIEIELAGHATLADIPFYVAAGLRALAVVLPFQAGLLAAVWAAGEYRLHPGKDHGRLSLLAPALAVIGLLLWIGSLLPGEAWLANAIWTGVIYPFLAAFGALAWLPGLVTAVVIVLTGIWLLRSSAAEMSLNQAARESAGEEAITAMPFLGSSDQTAQLRDQRRLAGAGRTSRLLDSPRMAALIWKQALRSIRLLGLGDVAPWLLLIGAALGGMLLTGWGPRLWGIVVWVLIAGQQAAAPLRRDLQRWWLLRQIPQSSQRLILAEIVPPAALALLLTWLVAAAGFTLDPQTRLAIALAAPGAVACAAFAAVYDVVRQARSVRLIAGIVPEEGALGVILGLIGPGLALFLIYELSQAPELIWLGGLAGLAAELLLAYFFLELAASALRRMG